MRTLYLRRRRWRLLLLVIHSMLLRVHLTLMLHMLRDGLPALLVLGKLTLVASLLRLLLLLVLRKIRLRMMLLLLLLDW